MKDIIDWLTELKTKIPCPFCTGKYLVIQDCLRKDLSGTKFQYYVARCKNCFHGEATGATLIRLRFSKLPNALPFLEGLSQATKCSYCNYWTVTIPEEFSAYIRKCDCYWDDFDVLLYNEIRLKFRKILDEN